MSGRVSGLGVRMSTPGGEDKESGPDVSLDALMDKAAGKSSVPGGAPKVFSTPEGFYQDPEWTSPISGKEHNDLLVRIFCSEDLGGENLRTPPHAFPCCPVCLDDESLPSGVFVQRSCWRILLFVGKSNSVAACILLANP